MGSGMSRARPVVAILVGLACFPALVHALQAPAPKPAAKPAAPAAEPAEPPVAPGTEAVVETAKGSFTIRLLPEAAPGHVQHFAKTAKAGGYDGTTFHRIIAGGIIQGGDPLSKDPKLQARYGTGGLGLLKAELSDRAFTRGTVAAARRPSGKDTGGSQFFVVVTDQPSMKGQYTIFGEVVSGMDVVDKISDTPVDGDRPRARVEMKVRLRDAEPTPASPVAP
jgi:cyclophilin family peptidyl-prolyl cis-trans isomerase